MLWFQVFQDGPEYEARRQKKTFTPPDLSLKKLHEAVPRHLFERSTSKSLFYIGRHLLVAIAIHLCAKRIPYALELLVETIGQRILVRYVVRPLLWLLFWGWQGMSFAGIWSLGHEAGHDSLSPNRWINAVLGMALHTFVLTPYYSWRATHRTHHKSTNNLERDETHIPRTREELKLPDGKIAVRMDYDALFEETPAYTLCMMTIRLFFGFQLYLLHNRKGNQRYPPWTSHYRPSSLLFRPDERRLVVISDIAIFTMLWLLWQYSRLNGWGSFCKFYLMPWFFAHSWMVMFTYLQHSDPTIPYYRKDQWTFARGALATVDRPIFGWAGRFFLHNINTDHVAHHFFAAIPFYNLPEVTEIIKPVLGDYYNYDSTPVLQAMRRSLKECKFVEDEGDVVFFKNRYGEAALEPKLN